MSIVAELLEKSGVIAAGEYAYRGDRFSYKGKLSEEEARKASIMCRATTMGTSMEGEMLESLGLRNGVAPVRGWVVRCAENSIVVVANVFCFVSNKDGSINAVLGFMREQLADQAMDLI
jgi:roadblock/LC7 domain-containing protein